MFAPASCPAKAAPQAGDDELHDAGHHEKDSQRYSDPRGDSVVSSSANGLPCHDHVLLWHH